MRDRFLSGLVAAALASATLLPMTAWSQALPAATTSVLCSAVVDGVAIYIDPTFAGASRYRIAVSDGVANAISAVPEPSTFAFLALGLGALSRRRSHLLTRVSEA